MRNLNHYMKVHNIKMKEAEDTIIVNRVTLGDWLAKENQKEHSYGNPRVKYYDVWLLDTKIFDWVVPHRSNADPEMIWKNLSLGFYFPKDRRIHYINIRNCLESFTNP